jgi:hypothetical protein
VGVVVGAVVGAVVDVVEWVGDCLCDRLFLFTPEPIVSAAESTGVPGLHKWAMGEWVGRMGTGLNGTNLSRSPNCSVNFVVNYTETN